MKRLDRTRFIKLGLLTSLLLLSAALNWHDLGTREVLGKDENATITKLDQPSISAVLDVTHIKVTGQPGNMQPLYFLVHYLFWPMVKRSAFVFRFVAAAFGLLAVAMTYRLGEPLLAGRAVSHGIAPAALVGSLLTALLPLQVEYSQVARPYTLLVFLSLASAYSLIRALESNRRLHWAIFVLASAAAFYTHYGAVFVLAAEGLYAGVVLAVAFKKGPSRRRWPDWLLRPVSSFILLLVLSLPGLLRWFRMAGGGPEGQIGVELTSRFFNRFLHNIGLTTPWLRVLMLGLLILGLAACLYRRRWKAAVFAVLWIAVPFLALSAMKSPRPFNERYVIFVPPVWLLMSGEGITGIGRGLGRLARRWNETTVRWAIVASLSLVPSVILGSALRTYYAANRASNRLEQTLAVVEDHVQPGDLIIVSPRFLVEPLNVGSARVLYLTNHLSQESFDELLAQYRRTWILYTSYLPPAELQEPLDGWIQARGDEFSRVPIKAISALAYRGTALDSPSANLRERITVLEDLATVSSDRQEAWLRYEELAKACDALADLYARQGESILAATYRDKAQVARETAPRPW